MTSRSSAFKFFCVAILGSTILLPPINLAQEAPNTTSATPSDQRRAEVKPKSPLEGDIQTNKALQQPKLSPITGIEGSIVLRRNNGDTIPISLTTAKIYKVEDLNKIIDSANKAAPLIAQSKFLLGSNADIYSKIDNIRALKRLTEVLSDASTKPEKNIRTDDDGKFLISDVKPGLYGIVVTFSTDSLVAYWAHKVEIKQSSISKIVLSSENALFLNQIQ
jgi:hypothetical protein